MADDSAVRFHFRDEEKSQVSQGTGEVSIELQGTRRAEGNTSGQQYIRETFTIDKSGRDHVVGVLPEVRDFPRYRAEHWAPYWLQFPLFWYPFLVNEVASRFVALQTVAITTVIIIFRGERWAWYISVALFGDYLVRLIGGPKFSVEGALADWAAWYFPRKYIPGPPKQFANIVSMLFAGGSALIFFLVNSDLGIAGAIVEAVLLFIAALEAYLNFCPGCWVFNTLASFGFIKQTNIDKCNALYDETFRTAQEFETLLNEAPAPKIVKLRPGDRALPTSYKPWTDAQKRESFHLVKNIKAYYFNAPTGIAGLAIAWKTYAEVFAFSSNTPYQILAIVAGVVYITYFLLYLYKLILYPRKVVREWNHPNGRHSFSAITISSLLLVILAAYDAPKIAEIFFWASGPLQLFISFAIFSLWISQAHDEDNSNPGWLYAPVGNVVGAWALTQINDRYAEAAWLWFSIGVFMWIVMFTITLFRVTFRAPLDDRYRPSLFLYVAAPAVINIAYTSLIYNELSFYSAGSFDAFAKFTFFLAIGFFFALTYLAALAYFARHNFDMSYWDFVFPLDTLAIISLNYHQFWGTELSNAIACTALLIASGIAAIVAANWISAVHKHQIFVPDEKWGPISFIKIFNYSFKEALLRLSVLSEKFDNEAAVKEFVGLWADYRIALFNHMKHEEEVLFNSFRALWPGVTIGADEEHDRDAKEVEAVNALVERLHETTGEERKAILARVATDLKEYSAHAVQHLNNVEAHLSFLNRKYIPVAWHKQLVREMFERTSVAHWARIVPFVLKNQYVHGRRVRFLAALRLALPEHLQQIGKWVYEGVDEFTFQRLLVDIPEIAPRHSGLWENRVW